MTDAPRALTDFFFFSEEPYKLSDAPLSLLPRHACLKGITNVCTESNRYNVLKMQKEIRMKRAHKLNVGGRRD